MHIDEIDKKILLELQRNGKISNVDLAAKVGLSPSPCLTRVRALEEQGVINRFVALLNPEEVGGTVTVFIQLTLERQSKAILDKFERRIQSLPEVMECYLIAGDADYLLRVVVKDTAALRDFIVEKLTCAPGVSTIRSGFALKQVKYETALPLAQLLPDHQRK